MTERRVMSGGDMRRPRSPRFAPCGARDAAPRSSDCSPGSDRSRAAPRHARALSARQRREPRADAARRRGGGIGKSRLVAEARTRAAQLGMVTLEDHCFESHKALPYAPMVDLLQAAARHAGPPGSSMGHLVEAIGPGALDLNQCQRDTHVRCSYDHVDLTVALI